MNDHILLPHLIAPGAIWFLHLSTSPLCLGSFMTTAVMFSVHQGETTLLAAKDLERATPTPSPLTPSPTPYSKPTPHVFKAMPGFSEERTLIVVIVGASEAVKWKMYLPDQRPTRMGGVRGEEVENGWG